MTLPQLQKEAREEFWGAYYEQKGNEALDSLTKRAYLAGIEAAKDCVPEEQKVLPIHGTPPSFVDQCRIGSWNAARTHMLEGIKKLEDSV